MLFPLARILFLSCCVRWVRCSNEPSGAETASESPTTKTTKAKDFELMEEQIRTGEGFIAALDQSGGSTPKALELYGFPKSRFLEGDKSMFDAIHEMRSRIVTQPTFTSSKGVLGAILFDDTMKRQITFTPETAIDGDKNVEGECTIAQTLPTAEYLWQIKHIVPFLKIDKGLADEKDGVQLMKPMPADLSSTLQEAKSKYGIFGTKMRSVIKHNNPTGIQAVVNQQFDIARQILDVGLIPIVEPEIDIHSTTKEECEIYLKECLLESLNSLRDNDRVILKVSLPSKRNFYQECVDHPKCLRVVALSGGYSREEATSLLNTQNGMIASFSRALTEGLSYDMSDEDFQRCLERSISQIIMASSEKEK